MMSHPVQLAFDALMTRRQNAWLAMTSVPLRSITFSRMPPFGLHGWSAVPGYGNELPEPMPALEVTRVKTALWLALPQNFTQDQHRGDMLS